MGASHKAYALARRAARRTKCVAKQFGADRIISNLETNVDAKWLVARYKREAATAGKAYLFSVVIAAYNAGSYLCDAVESLAKQTIGFENVQVIIVDDGSVDNTALKCEELSAKYPESVEWYERDNGGVSAARNYGIQHCKGLFVGFLDADDKISKNAHYEVLKFAARHEGVRVFAMKAQFFGSKSGKHPLNYICHKTRMVDLETEFDMYPLSATRSYFHYSAIQGKRFREDVHYTEDSLIVHEIMLEQAEFGAMRKPCYYYRKRLSENSASDRSTSDPNWYCATLEKSHLSAFDMAVAKLGSIPQYLQYAVAYDLGWRLKAKMPDSLSVEMGTAYRDGIVDLLKLIDDEVILAVKSFDFGLRLFGLSLKHQISLYDVMQTLRSEKGKLLCDMSTVDKSTSVFSIKNVEDWCKLSIDIVALSDDGDSIVLEGRIPELRISSDFVNLEFEANGISYQASIFPHPHNGVTTVFDINEECSVRPQLCFRAELPSFCDLTVVAKMSVGGGDSTSASLVFGKFARLNSKYPDSAYALLENGQIISLDGDDCSFHVSGEAATGKEIAEREACFCKEIAGKAPPIWIRMRKRAIDYRISHPDERLWLFTDRVASAEDSGEIMYRYMINHPIDNLRVAFVIRKDAPDYERLKELGGEVIAANSPEHFEAVICADKIISSAGDEWVINPLGGGYPFLKDLLHFKFVFLQHGVIKDSIASWLYKMSKNIDLFVTSAPRERQSIIDGDYGYDAEHVILTGLPRWDAFEGSSGHASRVIYLMPTWRDYLSTGFSWNASNLSDVSSSTEDFTHSNYANFYRSFLTDPKLEALLDRFGYRLKFAPHPRIGSSIGVFSGTEHVDILMPEAFAYSDAYKEMDMLITDYSSVAFNVAILKKPIIYVQFDSEEFYRKHTGRKDYYDYEKDGFGPVVKTKDELINQIQIFFETGMKMHPNYAKRVDEFFYYPENSASRAECVLCEIMKHDARRPYVSFSNALYIE